MDDSALRRHRARLLQAGLSPRHIRRHLIELRDHDAELRREASELGMDEAEAEAFARRTFGALDQVADGMIEAYRNSALFHRYPRFFTLIAPLLFYLLLLALTALVSVALFTVLDLRHAMPGDWSSLFARAYFATVCNGSVYLAPLLIGAWMVRKAVRLGVRNGYAILGVMLVSLWGSLLHLHVSWPDPRTHSEGSIGLMVSLSKGLMPASGVDVPQLLRVLGNAGALGLVLACYLRRDGQGKEEEPAL